MKFDETFTHKLYQHLYGGRFTLAWWAKELKAVSKKAASVLPHVKELIVDDIDLSADLVLLVPMALLTVVLYLGGIAFALFVGLAMVLGSPLIVGGRIYDGRRRLRKCEKRFNTDRASFLLDDARWELQARGFEE